MCLNKLIRTFLCGSLLFANFCAANSPEPAAESDIVVHTSKVGESIVTDVMFSVQATQKEVWSVLIDYDRMPQFLENLNESKIIKKKGNQITVSQSGKVAFGPFTSTFETIREVDLAPMREIRSHVISGNVKKADGVTTLATEAGRTKIVYHNESTPNINLPFDISKGAIESQVRKQFEGFRAEILRRARSGQG